MIYKFHKKEGEHLVKIRLAICLEDEVYKERLVRCLMRHYKEQYEFHVYPVFSELMEAKESVFDGYILEKAAQGETELPEKILAKALCLEEEDKYKEVYKLMEEVEALLSNQGVSFAAAQKGKPMVIGVFSMELPTLQLPFAAMLSDILGEKKKTFFLDLQEYSGFLSEGELGMEDMLAMAKTGNYTKGKERLAIGHDENWDYIYPMKNARCLLEAADENISNLVERLETEWGYEAIVINLGALVSSEKKVWSVCDKSYLLCSGKNTKTWREIQFTEEFERRGEDDVLHRIQRMEIPAVSCTGDDWKKLAKQWRWGELGNLVRNTVMGEEIVGKTV